MAYRFTVRPLPSEDDPSWVRIPRVGRVKLGKRQGSKLDVGTAKLAVSLEVHQGLKGDANKMLIRIAPSVMQKLGLREGDVIPIESGRKRAAEICVLAIDCSISMGDNGKIDKVKAALDAFLDEKVKIKDDGDMVGFVGFADDAWIVSRPSKAYRSKKGAFDASNLKWGTNLVAPLDLIRKMMGAGKKKGEKTVDKKGLRKHAIVIGDGNSEEDPREAAQRCKRSGIIVDTVGLVDAYNKAHQLTNLKAIADETGGIYVPIAQADLAKLVTRLTKAAKDKTMGG